jgi:hypothetical protein
MTGCPGLEWYHLEGCVLDVYRENQRREKAARAEPATTFIEASADRWGLLDRLRRDLHQRARESWAKRTNKDPDEFPLNRDWVVKMYFRFRKRNPDELAAYEKGLHEAANPPR